MSRRLAPVEAEKLLAVLRHRFEKHMHRHQGLKWADVEARLKTAEEKLWILNEMEKTGGESDVVGWDEGTGKSLSSTVRRKAPKAAGASAMTKMRVQPAKSIRRKAALWSLQLRLSRFSQKSSTVSCKP